MAETAAATDIGAATIISKKTGPSAYAPFAEVTEIDFPEAVRDSVEFTHFGSPNRAREFKPGFRDYGELGVSYNLIPGVFLDQVLGDHFATNLVDGWRLTFPNGATFDFNGFATKHARAVPLEDKMSGSVTLKITGTPVLTPAA